MLPRSQLSTGSLGKFSNFKEALCDQFYMLLALDLVSNLIFTDKAMKEYFVMKLSQGKFLDDVIVTLPWKTIIPNTESSLPDERGAYFILIGGFLSLR